jgi:hypothetical protein
LRFEAGEAGDAVPRVRKRIVDALLFVGVGCVVGRDAIDAATTDALLPKALSFVRIADWGLDRATLPFSSRTDSVNHR